jgi:hypothetical protein
MDELAFPKLPFPITVISSKSSMLKGPYVIRWNTASAGQIHQNAIKESIVSKAAWPREDGS